MSSEALTDRMIVLGRELSNGRSDKLNGCYARLTSDKRYLRVDKSGRSFFMSQNRFGEIDDDTVIAELEAYFNNETNSTATR